jgi:hypothetical protein
MRPKLRPGRMEDARIVITVRASWLVKYGGQGQDRTVDLPLFRCSACPARVALCGSNRLLMAVSGR